MLFVLSFIYVSLNTDRIYTPPLQRKIDLTGVVSYYARSDKWLAVLAERRLYIATPDGQVQNIVDLDMERVFNFQDHDVAIDGDSFIVYGTDNYKGTSFFASEKLARIRSDGKLEGYIFQRDHDRDKRVTFLDELDISARDGWVYFLNDEGRNVSLWKIPADGSGLGKQPESVAEFKIPMEAAYGFVNLETDRIYLQLISGDVFTYDLSQKKLQQIKGRTLPPDGTLDKESVEHLEAGTLYYLKTNLFYLALAVLGAGILFLLWRFLNSRAFTRYRKMWTVAVVLLMALLLLSEELMHSMSESATSKMSAVADIMVLTMESRLDPNSYDIRNLDQELDNPETQNRVAWCRRYLDEVCRQQGENLPIYMIAYAVNWSFETFALASTEHDYYAGQKVEDLRDDIASGKINPQSSGRSYDFPDKLGMLHIEDRYIHDRDGNLVTILEVGGYTSAIEANTLSKAVTLLLHLAALLAFWWVLFDRLEIYRDDIAAYLRSHERRSIVSRLKLGGIYFFVINIAVHLDYFLLVMVTADICGNVSALELAAMLVIPVTAYRLGTFSGSVITSSFIRYFGERKSSCIAAVLTIVCFALLAYACLIRNLYLLSFAKFMEGIFLESVLYSLAEGLPYEMKESEGKERQISRLKDGGTSAIIIGMMLAGLLAEHVNYAAMYLFGAACAVVLLILGPMVLRTPQEESADDETALENTRNAWLSFLKPQVLVYLGMVVTTYALLAGYEEYVFPIFAESCGLSDIELSNMGVIANTAAFVGIESFLPKKRFRPLILMTAAFAICGLALCMLLLNASIFCAFSVLLIICFIGRTVENYKELELTKITDRLGFDTKDVQENYYAVEDGIKVLQAPVLGPLCTVSVSFCCAALGLLCVLAPGLYAKFIEKKLRV